MYDEYTATEFEYSYGGTDFCAHSCDPYDLLQVVRVARLRLRLRLSTRATPTTCCRCRCMCMCTMFMFMFM